MVYYCGGNNAGKEQLNKLQKLQTKCLELVQGNIMYTNLNRTLGILSIEDMIKLENMKFGYKLVHWMLPQNIVEICYKDSKQEPLTKTITTAPEIKACQTSLKI